MYGFINVWIYQCMDLSMYGFINVWIYFLLDLPIAISIKFDFLPMYMNVLAFQFIQSCDFIFIFAIKFHFCD